MNISVFGLGYVGCVSVGCLAKNGHNVIGIDVNEFKVELINNGKPTIVEKDIDTIINYEWSSGKIKATIDYNYAVLNSDVAFICVGTPNLQTGQLNLDFVFQTASQIGEVLKTKVAFYVIAIRSTVFPGTNEKVGKIIEDISGKRRNIDFAVVSNPEFLREGSAVQDYYNPALTVLGSDNAKALQIMTEIYSDVNAPLVNTDIKAAEIIKYVNNSFHALKISFSNEIGNLCKLLDIDAFKVMDLFTKDDHLNISPTYFKPGMAYGGSCLPKDLLGLNTIAYDNYLQTPVLSAIQQSNELQKKRAAQLIEKTGSKKIGFYGLSFKKGTDDLRFSPAVELVEYLIGKGYKIKIFDENVVISRLIGANKSYIEEHLPHISVLLSDNLDEVLEHSDTFVFIHKLDNLPEIENKLLGKYIIDLVGVKMNIELFNYKGICW